MAVTLTESNFQQEVLNSELPVLVDFWAVWCGPCKMLSPVVERIAEEYAGKIKVCKVDIDEEMGLAMKYHISAIPTLMVFRDGKPVHTSVGVVSKSEIEAMLQ